MSNEKRSLHTEDFKSSVGIKGVVAPLSERNLGPNISATNLIRYFKQTRKLVESEHFKKRFSEEDCEKLVNQFFCSNIRVANVEELLKLLRRDANSVEKKLLIRTLAIHSFDHLSASRIESVDLKQYYNDLHILEREILPAPKRGGGGQFVTYKLASDELGQTRLHIYPPAPENDVIQDSRIHEHLGDCASLILAGELLNVHHKVESTDTVTGDSLAIYEVTPGDEDNEITAVLKRKGYVKETSIISKKLYKPGDYYHMPAPLKPSYKESIKSIIDAEAFPEIGMTYHTVANKHLTATLFTQRIMPYNNNNLIVIPDGGAEVSVKKTRYTPNSDECFSLLTQADATIRRNLENINQVNCGYIAKRTNEIIDQATNRAR